MHFAYMLSPPLKSVRDVGALIREQRRSRKLSQQALADAIVASRVWVSQVEAGKTRAELCLVLKALDALGLVSRADVDRSAMRRRSPAAKAPLSGARRSLQTER